MLSPSTTGASGSRLASVLRRTHLIGSHLSSNRPCRPQPNQQQILHHAMDFQSAVVASLAATAEAEKQQSIPEPGVSQKLMLFPTYARLSRTAKQHAHAASLEAAAAELPAPATSDDPSFNGANEEQEGVPIRSSQEEQPPPRPSTPSSFSSFSLRSLSRKNSAKSRKGRQLQEAQSQSRHVEPIRSPSTSSSKTKSSSPKSESLEEALQEGKILSPELPLPGDPIQLLENVLPKPAAIPYVKKWIVNVKGWAYTTREQSRRRKWLLTLSRTILSTTTTLSESSRSLHDERASLFLASANKGITIRACVIGLAPSEAVLARRGIKAQDTLTREQELEDDLESDEIDTINWDRLELDSLHNGISMVTDDSGFFSGRIEIPHELVENWRLEKSTSLVSHTHLRIIVFRPGFRSLYSLGSVELIPPKGLSLISDIDDTIKDSSVHLGRMAAINAALFTEAKEVSGMSDAYNYLKAKGVSCHYVSASPYQLYPMLEIFLKGARFPEGTLDLRNVAMFGGGDGGGAQYKKKVITRIMQDFPDRKFILIGDSGEHDIEIYAGLRAIAPDQIVKVFIRDVKGKISTSMPPPLPRRGPAAGEKATDINNNQEPAALTADNPSSPRAFIKAKSFPMEKRPPPATDVTASPTTANSDAKHDILPRLSSLPLKHKTSNSSLSAQDPLQLRARVAFEDADERLWTVFKSSDEIVIDGALKEVVKREARLPEQSTV
ncbi:hypothetical protein BC832DRAFT_565955 [Gaertneriomyces semiglobifer]|nr:hypothetical protein BC832DRAFT_565955 [Gaertneriomyces semiglobifer]